MAVVLFVLISGKGNLSNMAMYKQWNNLTRISGWKADGGVICGGKGVLTQPTALLQCPLFPLPRSDYFTYDRDETVFGSFTPYIRIYTAEGGEDEKREGVRVRVSAIV